jgi:hypothetical protein
LSTSKSTSTIIYAKTLQHSPNNNNNNNNNRDEQSSSDQVLAQELLANQQFGRSGVVARELLEPIVGDVATLPDKPITPAPANDGSLLLLLFLLFV